VLGERRPLAALRAVLAGGFASGKTGSSTVRRSFAALLREDLALRAVPRNPDKPGHFANFGLQRDGEDRLTRWMLERLSLAVWIKPATTVSLDQIETAVIEAWQPPINLDKVSRRSASLTSARKRMADEARAWAKDRDL
jgi:hypothetical protein